jgi:hypothetical protein
MVRAPTHAAIGTLRNSSMDTRSTVTITGLRRIRSVHAPAGRPISSHGTHDIARSSPISKPPALSTSTATSEIATAVTVPPTLLIVSPAHSSRKSRCHSSPPRRFAAPGSASAGWASVVVTTGPPGGAAGTGPPSSASR